MNWIRTLGTIALLATGCASAQPVPTQELADVESASRSATELGAQQNPQAQLYLKLANEGLQHAKVAMEDDDNATAKRLLERAKVDAELAVALSRDSSAKLRATKAVDASNAVREGARP